MENLKLKAYVIPKQLKEVWENNTLAYTVNCYMSTKTWDDGVISQSIFIGMNHKEYVDIMKNRFDCIEFDYKFFSQQRVNVKKLLNL